MATKSVKNYKKTYSKPGLRTQLKEKLLKGSKGGKAGQWSARKAQLLVKAYEKNNGKYKKNTKTRQSKKSLNAYSAQANGTLNKNSYQPILKMAQNAALGLKLHKQFKKGGTAIGVKRAVDLKNKKSLSFNTVKRMHSYFSRHAVDKKSKNFGSKATPSAGYIAWLLWGGDAGQAWSKRKLKK